MKQTHLDYIRSTMLAHMGALRCPALSAAFIDLQEGDTFLHLGWKNAETHEALAPDTLFEIGSISKTFTAVAAMQAVEAGKLDLDVPVTAYLPWFEVRSDYPPITAHHLLSHSAGLIGAADFSPGMKSCVRALKDTRAFAPPGERYYYSELGYMLLTLVLEAVHGISFAEILRQGILEPLGMTDTEPAITHAIRPRLARGYQSLYDDRPHHSSYPLVPATWLEFHSGDGCVASTVGDMAKFARMLLSRGDSPGGRLISPESWAKMTTEVVPGSGYGYGIVGYEKEGAAYLYHAGDMPGYEGAMFMNPAEGLGVVVLGATPYPFSMAFPEWELILAAKGGATLHPLPEPPEPERIPEAAQYAGVYGQDGRFLTFGAEGESLWLELNGERLLLECAGEDCFVADHPQLGRYPFCFSRDEGSGKVSEVCHGSRWYPGQGYTGVRSFAAPKEWEAYTGHYRSHSPWLNENNFTIVQRKEQLLRLKPFGDEENLIPLGDHRFAIEGVSEPETLAFMDLVEGKTLRACLSGCWDFYRVD